MSPKATVIIPTFGNARFSEWAIKSVQNQTVKDIEIAIVCDGSPPEMVHFFEKFAAEDPRILIFQFPKAPNKGEENIHKAIRATAGSNIFYCAHDDLWLPNHIETLQKVLEKNVFATVAHVIPFRPEDREKEKRFIYHIYLRNIAEAETRSAMINGANYYAITFCAHTRAGYEALDEGWATTPAEALRLSDLYMWQKFVRTYGSQCQSIPRFTAMQFSSKRREDMTEQMRYDEIHEIYDIISGDDVYTWADREYYAFLSRLQIDLHNTHLACEDLRQKVLEMEAGRESRQKYGNHSSAEDKKQKYERQIAMITNRPYYESIDKTKRILEVGPLDNPMIRRDQGFLNVYYADIRSTEDIKAFYENDPNVDCSEIVDIDYVIRKTYAESLAEVETFDYVVMSHVIEHIPELLKFFQDIALILKEDGQLLLSIPDHRYCFDHYRIPTSFAEIMEIYRTGIQNNPMRVLDFVVNDIGYQDMNNSHYWWSNPADYNHLLQSMQPARAKGLYQAALDGTYIDAHFSVFTPESFLLIMFYLTVFGLMPFECSKFYPTSKMSVEFHAVLTRNLSITENNGQEIDRQLERLVNMLEDIHADTLRKELVTEYYSLYEKEQYDELVKEIESLNKELKSNEEALKEFEFLKKELQSIVDSKSWKYTKPLRSLRNKLSDRKRV